MKYGITNVEYESNTKGDEHITKVRVHEITDDKHFNDDFKDEYVKNVIQNIKDGDEYITLVSTDGNKFRLGAKVIVKEKFITTEPNSKKEDNLGSLPLILPSFFE